ncbi:MAG: alkaline phosphatase D family protein [Planctomycetes bacterium]|nr:alkaline phosphatase D family protein [Planctomycetota bacterium]
MLRKPMLANGVELFSFEAGGLTPDRAYVARIARKTKTVERAFRTLAAAGAGGEFRVVVASCYYDGFHGDAHYASGLKSVWCKGAHLRLLTGDNLYADVPFGSPFTSDAWGETIERYLEYFWRSDYADVLGALPNLATWDDHEFWNNFPERVSWLSRTTEGNRPNYKQAALDCLETFQVPLNPPHPAKKNHRSFRFEGAPCVSFFLADTRTDRSEHDPPPPMKRQLFPQTALQDLEDWAATLTRPGVLVLGQPLWLETGSWKDWNVVDFQEDYRRIWAAIAGAPRDILVVSGDVHHSRLLEISLLRPKPGAAGETSRLVYEFVTSPACHIPTIATTVLPGFLRRQGGGDVEFPGDVPLEGPGAGGIKPEFSRYVFGTDARSTIGVLVFRDAGAKGVVVDCAFLDNQANGAVAPSTTASMDGGGELEPDPATPLCRVTAGFSLK